MCFTCGSRKLQQTAPVSWPATALHNCTHAAVSCPLKLAATLLPPFSTRAVHFDQHLPPGVRGQVPVHGLPLQRQEAAGQLNPLMIIKGARSSRRPRPRLGARGAVTAVRAPATQRSHQPRRTRASAEFLLLAAAQRKVVAGGARVRVRRQGSLEPFRGARRDDSSCTARAAWQPFFWGPTCTKRIR
jgi:hypothetical protein